MPGDDFYKRNQDLDEAGLYQLAAEEAARPGRRTPKSTGILKALIESLGLFDAQVREIEDLVEQKRKAGLIGKVRKFSRRQLYARCIRYSHHAGDPSPSNAELLEKLRDAMGFGPDDHEALLERLIDQGWAPPAPLTRSSTRTAEKPVEGAPEGAASPPAAPDTPAPAEPPAQPGAAPEEVSDSQDLDVRPTSALPKVASAEGLFQDVTPSGAMELQGEPESVDNLAFDPFETTAGADRLKRQSAATGQGPPMSAGKQFWMGAGIGALVVMIPLAFWLGTRQSSPPPTPAPEQWPTRAARPTPSPSPSPTPKPTKPKNPWKAFVKDLPPTGESIVSGVKLLGAMGKRMGETQLVDAPLKTHAQEARDAINQTFARRNEQIFEASQWGGEAGGYDRASLQAARAYLLEGPEKELPKRLVHAYYLGLLAFYMEAHRYPQHSDVYAELVPQWVALLKKRPGLRRAGGGMVLRVVGEDLRDGQDEALSKLGDALLDALL